MPIPDLETWLRGLPKTQLDALAERFGRRAAELGLCVTLPDGAQRPIPPVLSPQVVSDAWLAAQRESAHHLTALVHKVAAGMLAGPERPVILDALFPFERTCIEAAGLPEQLANVRADLFLGEGGAQALELNTTIPAMQGYSDIAARAFLEVVGAELGLSAAEIERSVQANGENAVSLWHALQASARAQTGRPFERVALVHRPSDAQLSELRYLARRWEALGAHTVVCDVDQLTARGDQVLADGQPVDFIYRHIFARYVPPEGVLGALLQKRGAFPLANAVSAPMEMKRVLAELSRTAHEPAQARRFGLDGADVAHVAAFVPWTRPLVSGPTVGPDGARVAELVAEVAAHPEPYVLKRSWDYGGRAVFLGFEADAPSTRARAQAAFGEALEWPALVARAAADPRGGGFVVQERVRTSAREHLLVTEAGPSWQPFFTDFSVYASLGVDAPEGGGPTAWGGVVRASTSAVVNIASGGGVAPVLHTRAAAPLLRALGQG